MRRDYPKLVNGESRRKAQPLVPTCQVAFLGRVYPKDREGPALQLPQQLTVQLEASNDTSLHPGSLPHVEMARDGGETCPTTVSVYCTCSVNSFSHSNLTANHLDHSDSSSSRCSCTCRLRANLTVSEVPL